LHTNKENILFRCDAGKIEELGTGHLIRSISLAKLLIKKSICKKKNIIFLIKVNKKYKLAKEILIKEKFNFKILDISIKDYSKDELDFVLKNRFKTIIIDRIGAVSKLFLRGLKSKNRKIILIDDSSKNKKQSDLSINSLIYKNLIKSQFSGFEYIILPSYFIKKNNKKINEIKKVFVSFGGFDKNKIVKKIYTIFSNFKNIQFYIDSSNIKNDKNVFFYNRDNFFKKMANSDLVICSGGLTSFDAINLNIPTLCIPQYKHQIVNIKKASKIGLLKYIKNDRNLVLEIQKMLSKILNKKIQFVEMKKNQKNFFNLKKINMMIKKIKHIHEN
jgi:spore coat polysaccharide biosynthesis predicted glycosyltransferase SpsG